MRKDYINKFLNKKVKITFMSGVSIIGVLTELPHKTIPKIYLVGGDRFHSSQVKKIEEVLDA